MSDANTPRTKEEGATPTGAALDSHSTNRTTNMTQNTSNVKQNLEPHAQENPTDAHPLTPFFAPVFGDAQGSIRIQRSDLAEDLVDTLDQVDTFIGDTGEAWVSFQTRDADLKLCEQAAVGTAIVSVETAQPPPSFVLRCEADGVMYAVWLIKPVDLQKKTVAEELTEMVPLPCYGGWSIVEEHSDRTRVYELEDVATALGGNVVPFPTKQTNEVLQFGELDPELMARTIEIGFSPFGQETSPGRWQRTELTVEQLIGMLKDHRVGPKNGNCFLQGPVIDGKRQANAIPYLDLLVIDLDTGESIDAMREKLQALGLFSIVYTTHSHLKDTTAIKKDILVKHFECDNPDIDQVCEYLRSVKRYQPEILEGATLLDTEHRAEGIMMVVQHRQMPKFRVVMVLKERFVIADRASTQQAAVVEWKERVAGASKMLGAFFDRSCVDPSRLFFTPRHPKGAKEWRIEVIAGEPLDIETCPRVTAEDVRREGMDPMERAAEDINGRSGGDYKTANIMRFFGKYGDRFEVDNFLMDKDGDGDRGSRSNGPGRHHRCPNDDAHSDAGNEEDRAFFCVNGTESDKGGAVAHCMHDTCSGLDRINFVDMICERVGITDAMDLLKNDDWVPKTKEDEAEEAAEGAAQEAAATGKPIPYRHWAAGVLDRVKPGKRPQLDDLTGAFNHRYGFVVAGEVRKVCDVQ